ncbi:MAG: BtpA/SgcQ family protein [Erysipelotrichaceae bacterium]
MTKINYPLGLVMIQPHPLPGSYLNNGESFDEVLAAVMDEAKMVVKNGFDGFILQNMHDGPVHQTAQPETIAYLSVIGNELKRTFPDKVLGILVNWDGIASLAVAEACHADFVRVEYLYTGVSVNSTGFMQGQCIQICEMKKRMGTKMPVYADAQEVNSMYLCPKPKPDTAVDVVKSAFADGVFMSGTSCEESLELIKEVRKKLPDTPIYLGGGATGDNVRELLRFYDGVSVATWIKNGDMKNPIDEKRAKYFMDEIRKARIDREKK